MMYMYSQVLNKLGKQPELVIVQYGINVDVTLSKLIIVQDLRRYAFKINNCTGLTLREEKGVTRKECRIN